MCMFKIHLSYLTKLSIIWFYYMKYTKKFFKDNFDEKVIKELFYPHEHTFYYCIPMAEEENSSLRVFIESVRDRVESFDMLSANIKISKLESLRDDCERELESFSFENGSYHFNKLSILFKAGCPESVSEVFKDLGESRDCIITELKIIIEKINLEVLELRRGLSAVKINAHGKKSLTKWELVELDHSAVDFGFVYILSNDIMVNIYKVGFTARNPDERAKEITAKYGLPSPFKVEYFKQTVSPYIVEQRVLSDLKEYQVGGEFIKLDINKIIDIVESHAIAKDGVNLSLF